MTTLDKELAEMNSDNDRRVQAVIGACPVTADWLSRQFQLEATGQSYVQWLECKTMLLAQLYYEDCGEEGLSSEDAYPGLAKVFQLSSDN